MPTADLVRLAFVVATAGTSVLLERRRIDRAAPLVLLACCGALVSFPMTEISPRAAAFVSDARSLAVLAAATLLASVAVRAIAHAVILTRLRAATALLMIAGLLVWIGGPRDELGVLLPMAVPGLIAAALWFGRQTGVQSV